VIVANGGIGGDAAIAERLREVDGVMVGREAYHHPWSLAEWDRRFFGQSSPLPTREAVEAAMVDYMGRQAALGHAWTGISRHMMGLWNGTPGARRWRQVWSDHHLKAEPAAAVAVRATAARLDALARVADDALLGADA
jgi:tRNA-dihydrouridine synthase A